MPGRSTIWRHRKANWLIGANRWLILKDGILQNSTDSYSLLTDINMNFMKVRGEDSQVRIYPIKDVKNSWD